MSQSMVTIDASGSGLLEVSAVGFQRAILMHGHPDADVSTLADGETLTLVASGVTIDRPAAKLPTFMFGLTEFSEIGKSAVKLGGQLLLNEKGDVLLDDQAFELGKAVDTGFDVGETFDFRIEINRNEDGTYDVTSTVGEATLQTAKGIAVASTAALFVQSQGRGKEAPGKVTIETVSIGEPPSNEVAEPE
ncbi:MAG: hypothetical protein AAGA25_10150 [Planctomycetota bacterium]